LKGRTGGRALQTAPNDDENGKKHSGRVCGFAEIREKNGFGREHKPLTTLHLGFWVQATRALFAVFPEPKGFLSLLHQRHHFEANLKNLSASPSLGQMLNFIFP
jgi:hypothetical protein